MLFTAKNLSPTTIYLLSLQVLANVGKFAMQSRDFELMTGNMFCKKMNTRGYSRFWFRFQVQEDVTFGFQGHVAEFRTESRQFVDICIGDRKLFPMNSFQKLREPFRGAVHERRERRSRNRLKWSRNKKTHLDGE
jgi:hypothetical protein